jgi:hypothetical protein
LVKKGPFAKVTSTVRYHDSIAKLQPASAPAAGPFGSPEWFALLEEHMPGPFFALECDGAIWPLMREGKGVAAARNWYAFRWMPLTRDAVSGQPHRAIARALRRKAGRARFAPLTPATADLLALALRDAGWRVRVEQGDVAHILPVNGRDYAAYLAGRPGKLRTTLKRKAKKIETSLYDRFDSAVWAEYEDVYAHSWKPDEGAPAMLRAFAQAQGDAGHLRMAIGYHEGAPIAAQFWTVEGGTAYIHKLSYREDARALSPGTTLTAALMERVIDIDGVHTVDFGTGDDGYKRDWMEEERPLMIVTAIDPARIANWPVMAAAALRRGARHLATRLRSG